MDRVKRCSPCSFSQYVSITQREGEIDWRLLCLHEFLLRVSNSQNTGPNPNVIDLRTIEDPFVSSLRISWSSSGFPDPLNPIFTGTTGISAFYGRYQWHQSINHYHLLYFNLIPQHPGPPTFTGSRLHRLPTTFLEDCPLYFRNSFLFIFLFLCTSMTHWVSDLPGPHTLESWRLQKLVCRKTSTDSPWHIEYKKSELFTRKVITSCMSSRQRQ